MLKSRRLLRPHPALRAEATVPLLGRDLVAGADGPRVAARVVLLPAGGHRTRDQGPHVGRLRGPNPLMGPLDADTSSEGWSVLTVTNVGCLTTSLPRVPEALSLRLLGAVPTKEA